MRAVPVTFAPIIGVVLIAEGVLAAPPTPGDSPLASSSVDPRAVVVWTVAAAVMLIVLGRRGAFSFRTLHRRRVREVEAFGALGWMVGGLALYVLLQVAGGLGAAAAGGLGLERGSIPAHALALWLAYGVVIVATLAALRAARGAFRRAGFRFELLDIGRGVGWFALAAPVVIAVMLISAWAADRIAGQAADPVAHALLAEMASAPLSPGWWALALAVVVGAPIVEEIIYRGCFQSSLLALTGSPLIAIVVTSAVFVAAHLGSVEPRALAGLFVLSLAFGMAMERTGRIGVPITMHAAFNAMNLIQSRLLD